MRLVSSEERLVSIDAGTAALVGSLAVPKGARGLVIFAHGSGSSRHSPRNNFVAQVLRKAGAGTLLIDLLTQEEDMDYDTRFDIALLSDRLEAATRWASQDDETASLSVGYFGASTGAAAALKASVASGIDVGAIVSRGGRPDLAEEVLGAVKAPTLLIVGGSDNLVIELNRKAYNLMRCPKEMVIVPGATHLFEEPGALEEVASHAAMWFRRHLCGKAA